MKRTAVKDLLMAEAPKDEIIVKGWVRTKRDSKTFSFIELNDGSTINNIQVIVDDNSPAYENIKKLSTGSSCAVKGKLVESPGKGQKWEVHGTEIEIYGLAGSDYPLQKKGHTKEFLREIAHLRPRTNLYSAAFRVRSRLAYSVHQFFQERGFFYVNTPIITASDCEGAGELFRVSTLNAEKPPIQEGKADFSKDFFAKQTYLSVSGQLEGETFATALSNIYTFGPTFRAENSNTARHAAEFWMIEPEIAFADLDENMDVAEAFVKHMVKDALENCKDDLSFFSKFVDKELFSRLENIVENEFARVSYREAVELLQKTDKKFEYSVDFGTDLQTEHERWLAEEHFKKPVFVYNYPDSIKPFYMRKNEDGETVAAVDLLVPGVGELIGGSQREERMDVLLKNLEAHDIPLEEYQWYVDTRKYGSVPHSGFGLGFERMIMFVTGLQNIRDVIPFPRTPGNCEY
ncbi:MAG: asparagine--tRNA ligase [Bdellovibrionota bacterium]